MINYDKLVIILTNKYKVVIHDSLEGDKNYSNRRIYFYILLLFYKGFMYER